MLASHPASHPSANQSALTNSAYNRQPSSGGPGPGPIAQVGPFTGGPTSHQQTAYGVGQGLQSQALGAAGQPTSSAGAVNVSGNVRVEQLTRLRAELEHFTDAWLSSAARALRAISTRDRPRSVNVLVTNSQLVPAIAKILLYGLGDLFDVRLFSSI